MLDNEPTGGESSEAVMPSAETADSTPTAPVRRTRARKAAPPAAEAGPTDGEPPVPPRVTRLAQGTLTPQGEIVDPLDADREDATIGGR